MSETYGSLPQFRLCDTSAKPERPTLSSCYLIGIENATGKHDPGKQLKNVQYEYKTCEYNGTIRGKIPYTNLKSSLGRCLLFDMRKLTPNGTLVAPSRIMLKFLVPGDNKRVTLLAMNPYERPQLLTFLYPGASYMVLKKAKTGELTVRDKRAQVNSFSWKDPSSWKGIPSALRETMSPHLQSIFTTELQAYDPDEEAEKLKVSAVRAAELLGSSKWQRLDKEEKRKLFQAMVKKANETSTYQLYDLTMSINNQHVQEQVEIGQVPQILFLVARIGGWMSVVTFILGVCWVQKNTESNVVKEYDELTFTLAAGDEKP